MRGFTEFPEVTQVLYPYLTRGIAFSVYQIAPVRANSNPSNIVPFSYKVISLLGYDLLIEAIEYGSARISSIQYEELQKCKE